MTVQKTLDVEDFLAPDRVACRIAQYWHEWNAMRQTKIQDWDETRRYIFATDTSKTTNSKLPWKNKTTTPKLCQIRDNLFSNYMAALFPKRRWLFWEADNPEDENPAKKKTIESYMRWAISQPMFKQEISKCVLDYIDYGNTFATVEWYDNNNLVEGREQVGYVGPIVRRVSPLDIVFNPVASTFVNSPKITRSIMTLGDLKAYLESGSNEDNKEEYQELFNYVRNIRNSAQNYGGDIYHKDAYFSVDGFTSYKEYLCSDYVELLTFTGDIYDDENDKLYKNHVFIVVDRHKLIGKPKPHPSTFTFAPIFHAGWRIRQDNLWAMGPLDNLIGLQYRIDHMENMKADLMDLVTFPPLKIKGYVNDFEWGPFEKIHIGDDGDVEIMEVDTNVLQANLEIERLQQLMEEMAGAPKEAMGFRTPGEKTKYEVQRLENAASRIFVNKVSYFEEQFLEPLLNAMLEMARRRMSGTTIRVLNDELKVAEFMALTNEDIVGSGRLRPLAGRHFAETAERLQNLNGFFSSPLGMNPAVLQHFSSVRLAQMVEGDLDISDYNVVIPFIQVTELAEQKRLMQVSEEQVLLEAQTATGQGDDFDLEN